MKNSKFIHSLFPHQNLPIPLRKVWLTYLFLLMIQIEFVLIQLAVILSHPFHN